MKAASVPIKSHSRPIRFGITNKEVFRVIENKVSMHYELLPKDWKNTSRKIGICEARQVFQFIMKRETSYSFAEIGYLAGGLDHADVVHNVNKIKNLCDVYKHFKEMVDEIHLSVKDEINEQIKIKLNENTFNPIASFA